MSASYRIALCKVGRIDPEQGRHRRPGRAAFPHTAISNFIEPRVVSLRASERATQRRQVPLTAFPPVGVFISPRWCSRWHGRWRAPGRVALHAVAASFFDGLRTERALNFLHRKEPGSHAMQDCAEPLGFVRSRKIGVVVHGSHHGGSVVPNPRNLFTFAGKEDERRR